MSHRFIRSHNGYNFRAQAAFPADPENGDLCYKTDGKLYIYVVDTWNEIAFE